MDFHYNISNTCCFFGHREINQTEELRTKLYKTIEKLIFQENVETFLFGSKSQFNDLCYDIVTDLKLKFPHIKRIYVRAEYPDIDQAYKSYLLSKYEDTFYPKNIINSTKAVYIKRNLEMINHSRFCVVYYDNTYTPPKRKSGTKITFNYAFKKEKTIINLFKKFF